MKVEKRNEAVMIVAIVLTLISAFIEHRIIVQANDDFPWVVFGFMSCIQVGIVIGAVQIGLPEVQRKRPLKMLLVMLLVGLPLCLMAYMIS